MNDELKKAVEILNKNNYIAIPVSKGQMLLCEDCNQNENECRYSTLGYTCSNLLCLNRIIKEQIDMTQIQNDEAQ